MGATPLQANLEALDIELSEEDMEKLSSLKPQRRSVPASLWTTEDGPYKCASALVCACRCRRSYHLHWKHIDLQSPVVLPSYAQLYPRAVKIALGHRLSIHLFDVCRTEDDIWEKGFPGDSV